MSRRPGIGAWAADRIASFYTGFAGAKVLLRDGGVSSVVRQDRKKWPLGRYLRGRVRDAVGLDQELLSMRGQLADKQVLRSMSSSELEALRVYREGVSVRSGFVAEEKFKRKSLERKL